MILCCLSLASLAQVPCRWTVESSRTAPGQFSCYRGETLSIEPTIKEYGVTITNYTATLWYQTNGMGSAWWQGTNGMFFTPAMDIGASAYIVYIQAVKTNGTSYRANAVIRMLGAPGETPNAIALPVERLDFASIIYMNAPWLLAESDPGIPSAIAQANTNAQGYANAALSNAVLFATTNQTTRIFNPANASEYIDGAGNKYVVSNFWNMTFSPSFAHPPAQSSYLFTSLNQSVYQYGSYGVYWMMSPTRVEWRGSNLGSIWVWAATTNAAVLQDGNYTPNGYAFVEYWATTNLIGTVALEGSVTAGLASKVSTNNETYLSTISKANTAVQPSALGSYLPLAGGTMTGDVKYSTEFFDLYYGTTGIRRTGFLNNLTLYLPFDESGEHVMASREWASGIFYPVSNPNNYISMELDPSVDFKLLDYYPRNNPSNYITLAQVPAGLTGLTVTNIVRTITHSNQTWGAAGTNATYRMSWDVTSGTFKVEEILP
jgi:hypothetical protein